MTERVTKRTIITVGQTRRASLPVFRRAVGVEEILLASRTQMVVSYMLHLLASKAFASSKRGGTRGWKWRE
jgi:hypothetical protein